MELHIPTLAAVAVFVAAILGALLLLAWRRDQSTDALVWWGSGYLLGGLSFALLAARGSIPDVLSIEMANGLLLVGYGLLYAGMRAFAGRETPVTTFLIAPLVWLTAMRVPAIAGDINARIVIVTSMQCTFVVLIAYELWRERAEPLLSRWPTIIALLTHAAMLSGRIVLAVATPFASHADLFRSPTFALLAFGTVLYTITFAFLLLSMTKERTELGHKTAALVDPLTGLANRRAFLNEAEAVIDERAARSEPLAVLLADLDRFKTVNDRFGHPAGDEVLRLFASVLRRCLGAYGMAGRLGGEEFAILLPGTREEAALELAETVRRAFAEAAMSVGGHAVNGTVSIGVATSRIGTRDLLGLLSRADDALYRAKEAGRNRVLAYREAGTADEATLVPEIQRTHLSTMIGA
jgi:diguanylate cyclase (GGDEF)-like protein